MLLSLRGARFGTSSPTARRDRVLNERLLGIEWKRQELAAPEHSMAGPLLLVSTGDHAEGLTAELEGALNAGNPRSR